MLGFEELAVTEEKPFSFAKHATIGCGGYARVAYYPETVEQTKALIAKLENKRTPFYVVGNMSNVLPADGESRRAFVCMKRLKEIDLRDGVYAAAGVTSAELMHFCVKSGKTGAEFLEGIPCTLGGATYMNAGVSGEYIANIVESVTVLQNGKVYELSKKDCAYAYKKSVFMDSDMLVLGTTLRLENANRDTITEKIEYYRNRRMRLPKGKSMGCVFKNPDGDIAGKLIEGAGLKGWRVGGAKISETHANFIINENGATAAQIRTLIAIVKNAVFAQYKIRLEEEIRYLE